MLEIENIKQQERKEQIDNVENKENPNLYSNLKEGKELTLKTFKEINKIIDNFLEQNEWFEKREEIKKSLKAQFEKFKQEIKKIYSTYTEELFSYVRWDVPKRAM